MAYESNSAFDTAREILEVRCLECHTDDQAKGDLLMTTREGLLHGGEGGTVIKPGSPDESTLIKRLHLPADDDERMPPKKKSEPLPPDEIAALSAWIFAGAPWPEGEILSPKAKTALPRWDAAPDPRILSIETFPKSVTLETAADFHHVIVIARFKDASTHDITRQSKLSLADASFAHLTGTSLTPKKDGSTTLRIDYRDSPRKFPSSSRTRKSPGRFHSNSTSCLF